MSCDAADPQGPHCTCPPAPQHGPVLVIAPFLDLAREALHGVDPARWQFVCIPAQVVGAGPHTRYLVLAPDTVCGGGLAVLTKLRAAGAREVHLLDPALPLDERRSA